MCSRRGAALFSAGGCGMCSCQLITWQPLSYWSMRGRGTRNSEGVEGLPTLQQGGLTRVIVTDYPPPQRRANGSRLPQLRQPRQHPKSSRARLLPSNHRRSQTPSHNIISAVPRSPAPHRTHAFGCLCRSARSDGAGSPPCREKHPGGPRRRPHSAAASAVPRSSRGWQGDAFRR